MRGRPILRTIRWNHFDPSMLRSAALALLFLAGALAGHLYAGSCAPETQDALSRYLADFCAVCDAGGVAVSLGACLTLYFGYTTLVFLLGFASIGVVLIPALSGIFGFFTMYTISCFVRCYGRNGALLALGLLAVRLLFTLPCFLALAGEAWPLSTELFLLAARRGKRSAPVLYGSRYFLLFLLCAVLLAVGVCCERLFTPLLFRLAMEAAL